MKAGGSVSVVLHDVCPARWAQCRRVVSHVRVLGDLAGLPHVPMTLLVVPRMHGHAHAPQPYYDWLKHMAAEGHELALHGWTHRDEASPAPRPGSAGWWQRRIYTAGEGEFAALTQTQASRRIDLALAWAELHALPVEGFVAPAWLLNAASWKALRNKPFRWTCTLTSLWALPAGPPCRAPGITFSSRTPWRRSASVAWCTLLAGLVKRNRLMRLELHPPDVEHDAVRRCWGRLLLNALLQGRQPVTLGQAAPVPTAQRTRIVA